MRLRRILQSQGVRTWPTVAEKVPGRKEESDEAVTNGPWTHRASPPQQCPYPTRQRPSPHCRNEENARSIRLAQFAIADNLEAWRPPQPIPLPFFCTPRAIFWPRGRVFHPQREKLHLPQGGTAQTPCAGALSPRASALSPCASALSVRASALFARASARLPRAGALSARASALYGCASARHARASALLRSAGTMYGCASALYARASARSGSAGALFRSRVSYSIPQVPVSASWVPIPSRRCSARSRRSSNGERALPADFGHSLAGYLRFLPVSTAGGADIFRRLWICRNQSQRKRCSATCQDYDGGNRRITAVPPCAGALYGCASALLGSASRSIPARFVAGD
jgi:hypothetical protein